MSKISEENIIRILSRLDVPGNAAKIYIFLLKNGPSTGYAVSKRSGVNNAVVYRELERLKNRNLVYQLGVKPLKYEAINMDGLLKNLKKQNKTEEKLLEKSLKDILKDNKGNFFLNKKFNFNNFKESQEFINKVGEISEDEGHHPDISFGWGYAEIKITTHAIEGLSENDFILAAKIDQLTNA